MNLSGHTGNRRITLADVFAVVSGHALHHPRAAPMKRPGDLNTLAPLPPLLDPGLLPLPLRHWLEDEAARLGVPIATVAAPALVAAGALIGSSARIQVMQNNEGWTEAANLWGMTVGHSGVRKTPAMNAAMEPHKQIERDMRAEFDKDAFTRAAQLSILDRQIDGIKRASTKTSTAPSVLASEEARLAKLLEERAKIPGEPPRILVNDVTMERFATLIEANPRGILQVRDELAGLLNTMHRDGHQGDRAFLLEGYSAGASHSFDRISRGPNYVYPFVISLYGVIQPSVLEAHIGSLDRSGGGDGFFARFQIVAIVNPAQVTHQGNSHKDIRAEAQAHATLRALDHAALAALAGQPRGHHRLLRFAPDAQEHFDLWRLDIDDRARALGEGAFAAYLSKSSAAGARLALIVHLVERAAGSTATEVTLEQAQRATGLIDYFIKQAHVLYAGRHHPHAALARVIASKIEAGVLTDGMTVTDVGGLFDARARGSMKDVREALDLLARIHWLKIEEHANPKARSTHVVRLNLFLTSPASIPAPLTS